MDQKGFSPITISLIGIVIIGVIFGIYHLVSRNDQYLREYPTLTPSSQVEVKTSPMAKTANSFPSPSPYPEDLKLISKPLISQTVNWKNYKNLEYGFEFSYPSDWKVTSSTNFFQYGELILINENELSYENSAAFIAVAKPELTEKDLKSWIMDKYKNTGDPRDTFYEFSEETINDQNYQKVFACGLGCYTYYHTKIDNTLYIFGLNEGAYEQNQNDQKLVNIINTLKFTHLN